VPVLARRRMIGRRGCCDWRWSHPRKPGRRILEGETVLTKKRGGGQLLVWRQRRRRLQASWSLSCTTCSSCFDPG